MVATEIRLDLNGKKGPDLWARLGESDTRQIVIHPGYFDPEGNWTPLIIDAENIFAKFRIVKPDNTFVIQDASLYLPSDPSIFVVTLPETATQVAGLGFYDLRIGDGETPDTYLYSAGGRFIVDDDMITDEMLESIASVNGLVFPDDFLTNEDMADYVRQEELDDYATKTYVNDAIAQASSYEYDTLFDYNGSNIDFWPTSKQTITLDKAYTDYDFLIIVCAPSSYANYLSHVPVFVPGMISGKKYGCTLGIGSSWGAPAFNVIDSTHLEFEGIDSANHMRLFYVYGVKW